jgi:hypothetical protein
MASGDTLLVFSPLANEPPAANYATIDTRNSIAVLDFDAGTDESAVFGAILPRHYGGGGLSVILHWMATSATTGNVKWNAAIERMNTDLDSDSFAADQTATTTTTGTAGIVTTTTITFTNGAQMDSLATGEPFRLRVTRDANDAGDTMTGDAELLRVEVRET